MKCLLICRLSVPEYFKTNRIPNFIARDSLADNEEEIRVHYHGLTAKETKVVGGPDAGTGER